MDTPITFYANQEARHHYGREDGTINVYGIFDYEKLTQDLLSNVQNQLVANNVAFAQGMVTLTKEKEKRTCDIRIGFADKERKILFMELWHPQGGEYPTQEGDMVTAFLLDLHGQREPTPHSQGE